MKKLLVVLLLLVSASAYAVKATGFNLFSSVSMATNQTSISLPISKYSGYAIQAVWVGSPVGTLKVNVSNDPGPTVTNWTVLANSTATVNGAGDQFYNISGANYTYVQLVYTASSGGGTLSATATGKE
jgi:hypothetical protein